MEGAWAAASEELYKATQGGTDTADTTQNSAGAGTGNTDEVTDVEYEEVDDKK